MWPRRLWVALLVLAACAGCSRADSGSTDDKDGAAAEGSGRTKALGGAKGSSGGVPTTTGGTASAGGTTGGTSASSGGTSASSGGTQASGGQKSIPDSGGTPPSDASTGFGGGATPGPHGCKPLEIAANKTVDGYVTNEFRWSDANCDARTVALVPNDVKDSAGLYGGQARTLTYQVDGKTRTATGNDGTSWRGFGYVVTHYASTFGTTRGVQGTHTTPLTGAYHAIHQFRWRYQPGGNVDVTVEWFFATGASNPVYAITFDATAAGKDAVNADTRAPYGDVSWGGTDVDGVGWGDQYQFATTGNGPLKPTAGWNYTKPNVIPYVFEWSNGGDAEMGLVSTQPFAVKISGGDYGGGLLSTKWGTSGASGFLNDANLPNWLWPFQLNQYELPATTASHRVAWGMNYGAVGQSVVNVFGKTYSGYPYQSYSVFVVLGTHSTHAVLAQVSSMESARNVVLSATRGVVATDGPAGVARTDRATYSPKGFNPIYGVWEVASDNGAATMKLDVGAGSLVTPTLLLTGYNSSAPPKTVSVNGHVLTPGTDYFPTVDPLGKRLFLTLDATLTGSQQVSIE